jgi:GTPase
VEKVLHELGVAERPRLRVFNKVDLLTSEEAQSLTESRGGDEKDRAVIVSARTGQGLEELRARIDTAMPVDPIVMRRLRVPMSNARELAMIYACGRVTHSEVEDGHMNLEAELPESLAMRLETLSEQAK